VVQEPAPVGVLLGGEQVGEELLDARQVLVAFGQGADADENVAQVGEGLGCRVVRRGLGG
jgi:hypothetical protein